MNNIMRSQLNMLKTLEHSVDGKITCDIPESFSQLIFYKKGNKSLDTQSKTLYFIFADYIIKPFAGFDFHTKFNKGVPPPFKVMTGDILKETEKMYYISCKSIVMPMKQCMHCLKCGVVNYVCEDCSKLYNEIDKVTWEGWIPKKSLTLKEN